MCAANSGARVLDCDLPTIFYVVNIGMGILYTRHKRQKGGASLRRRRFGARYLRNPLRNPLGSMRERMNPMKQARQRPGEDVDTSSSKKDIFLTAEQKRLDLLEKKRQEIKDQLTKDKLGNIELKVRNVTQKAREEGIKKAQEELRLIQGVRNSIAKREGVDGVTLARMAEASSRSRRCWR